MAEEKTHINAASGSGVDVIFIALVLLAGAVWSVYTGARTTDPLMATHAMLFLAAIIIGGFALISHLTSGKPVNKNEYEFGVVKAGVFASVFWGIAGFLVGVIIAGQLAFPNILYFSELPWTSFGRLRPLHTSAVIFAFGGNVLIATSFYVVQRTSRARLWGGLTPWFVFWGYNLFIVIAATGYLIGVTQSKEYAEPEWYADIWLVVVWVAYLFHALHAARSWHGARNRISMSPTGTIWPSFWSRSRFCTSSTILPIPVSLGHARRATAAFSGVQDAHDAVVVRAQRGRLLPDRGLSWAMMYYYLPKRAGPADLSPIGFQLFSFWSHHRSPICGPGRITCITRRCLSGRRPSA